MTSEDHLMQWVNEKLKYKSRNNVAPLSTESFSRINKGPLKEILHKMSTNIRSNEVANAIRNHPSLIKLKELNEEILKTREISKNMEENNSLKIKELQDLAIEKNQLEAEAIAIRRRITTLRLRTSLSEDQSRACKGMNSEAIKICQSLSPLLNNFTAPAQNFVFDPSRGKLESACKSHLRTLIKEMECKEEMDVTTKMYQTVAQFCGQDRLMSMCELGEELKTKAKALAESVDLERDAKKLSSELESIAHQSDGDFLQPLQDRLDSLAREHAILAVRQTQKKKEVQNLQNELQQLLLQKGASTIDSDLKKVLRDAKVAQLRDSLSQLILQDRAEHTSNLQNAKIIMQIQNFTLETEHRKDKIVQLLGQLSDVARLSVQRQAEIKQKTQRVGKDFESFEKIRGLLQGQMSLVTQNPLHFLVKINKASLHQPYLSTHVDEVNPDWQCALRQSSPETIVEDILRKRAKLRWLQCYLSNTAIDKQSALDPKDCSLDLDQNPEKAKACTLGLIHRVEELEDVLTNEKQHLVETLSAGANLWQEQCTQAAVDPMAEVEGLTLQQWCEQVEGAVASGRTNLVASKILQQYFP